MSNPSIIRAGYEPIPGYILRQRLGAGGYGEVWSADAPGGLKKAVKLVYGTLDEQRASSELRSLQRIRQVHHPLLLSLERIEIVNGQLIIVTELAESSLMDCFHAARRRQLQGIPRDQLLDFLRDAGDALDYLSQKHDLQHLDVKPGNLLIMADRIKVADFGLIKDLHDPNVSIVSGLTPTHAAPELFDGRPDRLSDLYSLAIVYQEMLTGRLPFDGKTAGELARQHLHQAPNLEPLPPADRRVVARALAKHPLDRYSSCRAFIEELRNSGTHEKYAAKARINEQEAERQEAQSERNSVPRAEISSDSAKGTSTCTSPALLGGLQVMPPLPTADSAEGWQAPLSMFIGLGGIGCSVLTRLRQLLDQKVDNRRRTTDHQWLAIDTDFDLLSEISNTRLPGGLDYRNVCHLKLFRPQDYRERTDERFNAISRRWLYNIPRSQKTEGVRPLAMLTLVDHFETIQQRLADQLRKLLATRQSLEGNDCQPIRIYLCGSLHGGTGSAIAADIGRMIRTVLAHLNCHDYFLTATMSIATTTGASSGLPAAIAMSALCEIDALMEGGQFIPPLVPSQSGAPSASSKPFDWMTLIDGGIYGNADDCENTLEDLTESLWVDSHTLVGPTLDAARHVQGPHHQRQPRSWLRSARSSMVQLGNDLQPAQLARLCCIQAITRWHACVTSGANLQGSLETTSQALGWSQNQTAAIVEHLSSECLRLLRLTSDTDSPGEASLGPNPFRNRISQSPEATRLQLERDLRICRDWLASHMRPSYVSWKLLQRIVLRTVERMLELATGPEAELRKLADEDTPERETLSPGDAGALRHYIKQLSDRGLQQLQQAQPQIEQFAGTLSSWCSSLQAEQKMQGNGSLTLEQASIPVAWRHMLQRLHSTLDNTLQRYVVGRCFNSYANDTCGQEMANGMLSLEHLLRLSIDMATKLMGEAGITPLAPPPENASGTRSIVLQDMESLIPPAALRGGKLCRMLAVTSSQLNDIKPRLEQLDMVESCTIVPAQFGEEPVAVCDANDLNMAAIVSAFWRPTVEAFRLAERLHTRCDVNWPSIDMLLASDENAKCGTLEC